MDIPLWPRWMQKQTYEDHHTCWRAGHPLQYLYLMTWVIELCKLIARRTLPFAVRRSLWAQWGYHVAQRRRLKRWWAIAWLRHCSLHLKHIRPGFGVGHGQCIDRYYMETFLDRYATDVHGHVLEIADNTYTRRFGGQR